MDYLAELYDFFENVCVGSETTRFRFGTNCWSKEKFYIYCVNNFQIDSPPILQFTQIVWIRSVIFGLHEHCNLLLDRRFL